jgi:hypothetical protein
MLVGGPDVWEEIRAVRSTRGSESSLKPIEVLALVESNTGVPGQLIQVALRCWAAYPDEIDAWIADVDRLEWT